MCHHLNNVVFAVVTTKIVKKKSLIICHLATLYTI